jgi:hypothetical protein
MCIATALVKMSALIMYRSFSIYALIKLGALLVERMGMRNFPPMPKIYLGMVSSSRLIRF